MHHELHSEIAIDAPAEVVWDVLIDLERYHEWNPFIVESAGRPQIGERLINRLKQPGGKTMTFKPVVTEVEPHQTFEWLGRLVLPGLFDGRHRFDLRTTPSGGTTLIQTEQFDGLLVRVMRSSLDTRTLAGFEAMNDALRVRAEARAAGAT